jgi:predicted GH43/DUF377 family glycosyl hydrolase
MRWTKHGVIYCADRDNEWALTHAALPVPLRLNDDVIRIYCAFRADKNISRIGYVDVSADNPKNIIGVSPKPVLNIGKPGTFDDNGVIPVCAMRRDDTIYLYYGGFQLGGQVPYFLFSGLAISHDGGESFERYQQAPIIGHTDKETFFRTAPFIIHEGALWKMWYIAGSRWVEHNGKKLPHYNVKYLESNDGLTWGDEGYTCFEPEGDEHGFGRPYVIRKDGMYHMYYSIRSFSKPYHLGYAQSADGKNWIRKDNEIGLDVSAQGPDCEMICYGAVWEHRDQTYMFYNGNNYGGTGICFARLE